MEIVTSVGRRRHWRHEDKQRNRSNLVRLPAQAPERKHLLQRIGVQFEANPL